MTWHFITLSEEEVQKNFSWSCYLFLLAIFVAMTNQVRCESLLLYKSEMTVSGERYNKIMRIQSWKSHF
jgi:hypothetical protein